MKKIKFGNHIQDYGYFIVPNILIDKRKELGIDEGELSFIMVISRFSSGWTLRDDQIDTQLSSRTMQRRRKSLKQKGLIDFYERKARTENGWINFGISYDLSPLENKLKELYEEENKEVLKNNKNTLIYEILEIHKNKIEFFTQNCPSAIKDNIHEPWKEGEWFNLKSDIESLENLDEDVLQIIRRAVEKIDIFLFAYFSKGEVKQIVPRISLFVKNPKFFYELINLKVK